MSKAQDLLHKLVGPLKPELPLNERIPIKAFSWARVSTGKQEESGLSMPEQLRHRQYAAKNGFEIVAENPHSRWSYLLHPVTHMQYVLRYSDPDSPSANN